MKLFDKDYDISIIIECSTNEAVRLAALDLQRNLRRLSGKSGGFPIKDAYDGYGILIRESAQGEAESYTVTVEAERVLITGSDTLGVIYGIYAFTTRCLKIHPTYRLIDLFPAQKDALYLEEQSFSSLPRAVRFRGWFINDEDLLTELKISGGTRNIDYPFYQNVMDTDVLDMILETALRLEINLVIPSSFVDIANPAEEALVEAVCRRGLYVSQHHVEPMGVSFFGADNYLKKHGYENEAVSFLTNRERMIEIWQYYAKKWAKYGDRVVWQLGLRGKADQAVWKADPTIPDSMKVRGAIITDAIQTQYRLIQEVLGSDQFDSTATLWNEGSILYGTDVLKLPEKTIPVFSDLGVDQMFGEDFFTASQKENRSYGVYYHACFWTRGPHLAEGCNPLKMAYCYNAVAKNEKLCYSILNISNVRPVHLSAVINAKLLNTPASFDALQAMREFDNEIFGECAKEIHALRKKYYTCFADFGEVPLRNTAKDYNFYFRQYDHLPFIRNAATDGQLVYFAKYLLMEKYDPRLPEANEQTQAILEESAKKFADLYEEAKRIEPQLSAVCRTYFNQFFKLQISYMHHLTQWCVACMGLTNKSLSAKERQRQGEIACSALEAILDERKVLESGEWEHWHRGEKKLNIRELLKMTDSTKNGVTG